MEHNTLYSIVLEFQAENTGLLAAGLGNKVHGMFHSLLHRIDPDLSRAHHAQSTARPFTLSWAYETGWTQEDILLKQGQLCRLRVTLLDGGELYHHLVRYFSESKATHVALDKVRLTFIRMFSIPDKDPTDWVHLTDWKSLLTIVPAKTITMRFFTPTAFNRSEKVFGERTFELLPKPLCVWESLLRVWNLYAPEDYRMDKQAICSWIEKAVTPTECDLHIETMRFTTHIQKGFVGICQYQFREQTGAAPQATSLALFGQYAGIGSKTPMGMGQVKVFCDAAC